MFHKPAFAAFRSTTLVKYMTHTKLKVITLGIVGLCLGLVSCDRTALSKNKSNNTGVNPVILQTNENLGVGTQQFSIPEIEIVPSPDTAYEYAFSRGEQIIDYSVSPAGSLVAVIVEKNKRYDLKFWKIGASELLEGSIMPQDFKAETVVWHPQVSALFVLGTRDQESVVYRVEQTKNEWNFKQIFSSANRLQNIVICPHPFIIEPDYDRYFYRLFLGMDNGDNTYRIVSITEHGKTFYQVIGPEKTQTIYNDNEYGAKISTMKADWALPVAFDHAGDDLIWKDQQNNYFWTRYEGKYWGEKSHPWWFPMKNKETAIYTPNGLGMISWQKNTDGIELYLRPKGSSSRQLAEYRFEMSPVSVPDGRGIVGKTIKKGVNTLLYAPITMPLHNVLNAFMFVHSSEALDLFQKHYGLFRPTNYEQLYALYETEGYSRSVSKKPYLVTTDIFWEIFGAAYQGVFIVKEREQAIPNFWQFIDEAYDYFKATHETSKWNIVLTALQDLKANNKANDEALRIINGIDDISDVTQERYAYSDLKPRGHYTSTPKMELYFKAFRYFTTILSNSKNQDILKELENLPKEVSKYAINWINSYSTFIAPSRSPLVWKDLKTELPKYCQYPNKETAIFPLSWGFDNEIFSNTVYREDRAEDKRIQGPNGKRFLPSGLDIAAVLGNGFADKLLADEYAKYPPLRKMIANLRSNYQTHSGSADFTTNLYNQWMNAMAVQWADSVNPVGNKGNEIWQAKRLQTGLATWATLRHATVLVNERHGAQAGECGFEEIFMKQPRGSVEADPYTFRAIADLFQELLKTASKLKTDSAAQQAVYNGLIERLKEARTETLLFADLAEKGRKGEKLTENEYEKIFYVARVAEHLFLIFRSLHNEEYGLSTPEPIGKIADVSHDGESSYLMAAVGNPMIWDYIVPYYGRYQIVTGSIYSYYEFESQELLNDKEWRQRISKQAFLPWIKPYVYSD